MEKEALQVITHDGHYPDGELVDAIVAFMRRTHTMPKKEELVRDYSRTGAERVSQMTERDALALLASLRELDDKMERMRRKVIAIAHQIGWKNPDGSGKADYKRIDSWMTTYRGCLMNRMNYEQLYQAVTQFEQMFRNEIKKNRK